MASKENSNPLKILVISMGFLLIGGTVLLMAVVWKKVSQEEAKTQESAKCEGGKLDLMGRGKIVNQLIDKDIIRITLKKSSGQQETVSAQLCTGKILGSLVIESDN